MESDWDHGFFLGLKFGKTEYLIGFGDVVYSCATMRRLEENKAFDPTVMNETEMRYRDYILEGARSTPSKVRLPTAGAPVVDPEMSQLQLWRLCAPWIQCWVPGMRATPVEVADSQKSHSGV